eukprot:2272669-Pyramimonas_sp.AAC.1
MQEFGSLCVEDFQDVFIMPLMRSLGLLDKYTAEASDEFSGGRRLSKCEAPFAGTAGAREWHRSVVEDA